MTFLLLSILIATVALAVAVVPVGVILVRESRPDTAAGAGPVATVTPLTRPAPAAAAA
jgi:hypothetical protein